MDWQSCERCKHELKDGKKGSPCFDCGIEAKGYEPKTNADAIRNMTDEELADMMFESCVEKMGLEECRYSDGGIHECKKCALEWLQSEVKEGNTNENT